MLQKTISRIKYFEAAQCGECLSRSDLQVNKYTDEIVCVDCINKELAKIEREKEVELEELYGSNFGEIETERER